jgi:hypothetical protein
MIAALLILFALVLAVPACAAHFDEIIPQTIPSGAGAAWGDYDGDGYPDLFTTAGTPPQAGALLFRNNQNLTFANVSASLGLPLTVVERDGPAWADYNNDGMLDLLVACGAGYAVLFRRDEAEFVEVGESAGFHVTLNAGRSAAWCDYNADNLLDAFCSNLGMNYLMRNSGDGTFAEVSGLSGMTSDSGMSASWGDYDNDGCSDLVIGRNNKTAMLFHNEGDGTFTDVSAASGIATATDNAAAIWADYDNDGWLDCYLTTNVSATGSGRPDALFHNNQDGTFTDVSAAAGMSGDSDISVPAAWADYDNDGWLDLLVGNLERDPFLYHNNGNGTFTDVAYGSGLEGVYQRNAAVWADIDLDGRLDLFQAEASHSWSHLFHNVGPAGNWLRVRALTSGAGDATGSSAVRDAVGSRVELNLDNEDAFSTDGQRTLTRLVDGGSGWLGQNEQIAHFGLGSATLVAVRVRFPDGSIVIHRSVPANGQITIRDVPADRDEIFDDVPLDFWAYSQTKGCVDAGIVSGYDDGLYHPDWPVTRDQMAVYISRALAGGDDNVPDFTDTPTFPDVDETHWALDYVEYAVEQGVVGGYEDGTYQPDNPVTRDQMAVYVARALVAPSGEAGLADYVPADPRNFPDVPDGFWSYRHVEYCVENGVVAGYEDGYYHPEITVTRDQMAVYVARAFNL